MYIQTITVKKHITAAESPSYKNHPKKRELRFPHYVVVALDHARLSCSSKGPRLYYIHFMGIGCWALDTEA